MGMDAYRDGSPREASHEFRFRPPIRWKISGFLFVVTCLVAWADWYAVFSPTDQLRIDCTRAENVCVVSVDQAEMVRISTENLERAEVKYQRAPSGRYSKSWTSYFYTGYEEPRDIELSAGSDEEVSKVVVDFAHSNAPEVHTKWPAHSRTTAGMFLTPIALGFLIFFLTSIPWSSYRLRYVRDGADLHIEAVRRRFFREHVTELVVAFSEEMTLRVTPDGVRLHDAEREDRLLVQFASASDQDAEGIREDFRSFISAAKDR